jgi:hypothetical protein
MQDLNATFYLWNCAYDPVHWEWQSHHAEKLMLANLVSVPMKLSLKLALWERWITGASLGLTTYGSNGFGRVMCRVRWGWSRFNGGGFLHSFPGVEAGHAHPRMLHVDRPCQSQSRVLPRRSRKDGLPDATVRWRKFQRKNFETLSMFIRSNKRRLITKGVASARMSGRSAMSGWWGPQNRNI